MLALFYQKTFMFRIQITDLIQNYFYIIIYFFPLIREVMCALGDSQGSNFKMFNTKFPLNQYFQMSTAIIYRIIWVIMLKAIIQKKKSKKIEIREEHINVE
jgi:hypothetical protein